jgi:L-arabinose isomerase
MFILGFFGNGATQAEHYYADYNEQINYVSHSGPGDYSIANKKPLLKWLEFFHGKRGSGVSCEFSIKEGPITLLSLAISNSHNLKFIATEAIALASCINSGEVTTRVKFNSNVSDFIEKWTEEGPSHHSAMGLGHHVREIEKVAEVLGVELVII